MSVHTPKSSLKFELPDMLSYHTTWDDADYPPQLPPSRRGLFARVIEALGRHCQTALARRAATNELAMMSDCELADIGINRCHVDRLFDPEFAHEYQQRGGLPWKSNPMAPSHQAKDRQSISLERCE
jgi:uncharacterized protein YjiS (DUF1127 family)